MRSAIVIVLLLGSTCLAAEEKPSFGLVYNAQENSGLKFSCTDGGSGELSCEFSQMTVYKKANSNDLDKKLSEAKSQFSAAKQPMEQKLCAEMTANLTALRGNPKALPGDMAKTVQAMSERERQDLDQNLSSIVSFCRNPTEETMLSIVRMTHQREVKSCRITTSHFTQTFKRVGTDSWASSEGPGGLCGVITISQLNRVSVGTSNFWVYTTKSTSGTKKSSSTPQICKNLDETEHYYDWRGGGDRYLGCDYVELGF